MASALLLLGGCDDAKYGVIRHAVYFTDAEDSPQKSVVIEESGGRIPITVRSVGSRRKRCHGALRGRSRRAGRL